MDPIPCSLHQLVQQIDQNSIFKNLLTQIQMQITSPQRKNSSLETLELPPCPFDLYAPDKQNYYHAPDKNTSEWAWKDEIEQQMEEISPVEDLPQENVQLKRVQSMRIEQENKLTLFIRSHTLIPENHDLEGPSDISQTMNLSPRKKKRIDKDNKDKHPQVLFASHTKRQRTFSGKDSQ